MDAARPIGRLVGSFTLIELLVVIAIILLLGAILLPALRKARERSHQAVCLNNLRQLHLSYAGYADDHRGVPVPMYTWDPPYVGWTWWIWLLQTGYVRQGNATEWVPYWAKQGILMCPSVRYDPYAIDTDTVLPWANSYYSVNLDVTSNTPRERNWSRVSRASETLLFTECTRMFDSFYVCGWRLATGQPLLSPRHSRGLNLLFCDGHGEWFQGPAPAILPIDEYAWPWYINQF